MPTETAPKISARIIGHALGLGAPETNILLEEEGFLTGSPTMYSVTEKGRPYATEKDVHHGTGGYAFMNVEYQVRTWDPSIIDALDVTPERRQRLRETASAARKQSAALRAAQTVTIPDEKPDGVETSGLGVNPLVVVAVIVAAVGSIVGIVKFVQHRKRTKINAPGEVEPQAEAQAELPGSDDLPQA